MSGRQAASSRRADLAYAIRLLASGQTIDRVWREAGYDSRKALADRICRLADQIASSPCHLARGPAVGEPRSASAGDTRRDAGGKAAKRAAKARGRPMLRVTVYSDGAAIRNPGPAGCGAVVMDESGEVLLEDQRYLGETTNNVAEYEGALLGLTRARELGAREVELRVDSELLVNQIRGGYRVKSANLIGLYRSLRDIAEDFDRFEISQIGRGDNRRADKLANLAIASRGKE